MASLLLLVFLFQLATHLINSIGTATINELAWLLYNKLPTSTHKSAKENIRLKREVLRLKKEMNGVSAQDQFSKWARLRRQHDKAVAEYDKSVAGLSGAKAKFDTTISTTRMVLVNGPRFFLQYWYARQALFWIPERWVPGYVEWILAFPRAPRGSISIQIWNIACANVIAMLSEALLAIYALSTKAPESQPKGKPQTFAANPSATTEPKKEL